jgi:hypothetical protein
MLLHPPTFPLQLVTLFPHLLRPLPRTHSTSLLPFLKLSSTSRHHAPVLLITTILRLVPLPPATMTVTPFKSVGHRHFQLTSLGKISPTNAINSLRMLSRPVTKDNLGENPVVPVLPSPVKTLCPPS